MAVLIVWLVTPVRAQSLFESSQSETHETLVSNSFTLGGFIRSVAYLSESPDNDHYQFQSAYGQAAVLMDARAGDWASARAELRFSYGTEYGVEIAEAQLREAYVDLHTGPASFRLGKLINPTGKGSVFNPTDKLTPLDPTVRSPEEDDLYLGYWGLQGRLNLGTAVKLTATWKPLYRSSVLLIDPVPMPEYVRFLDPDLPGVALDDGSYGIRLDAFTGPVDVSVSWFEGYHSWPGLAFDSFVMDTLTMEPQSLCLQEKPYRIRMAGMDLSLPLGSWIWRAEAAWQDPRGSNESHEYIPFPELSYTSEIEWSGSHLNLVAGYYGKYIIDYSPPVASPSLSAGTEDFQQLLQKGILLDNEVINGMIRERIGAFNRLYNYQMEEFYHMVFLVGKVFFMHDQVELTLPLIHHLTTSEWLVQPGISWMPADGLKVTAGFSGMYGGDDSLYDLVGPVLNAGFLSIKLTF